MSENASGGNAKTKAQDLFGILACMLGGFSAVSVFLAMEGQESKNLLARPVEGAMTVFGTPGALVVAAGLAVLGTILFLARRAIGPVRHLVGVFALGLGVSLVVGGVRPSLGGLLGSALPEALPGTPGQVASFAIGVTVLVATIWVVWLVGLGGSAGGSKPADLTGILKPGTADRPSDGVSVAEARALQGLKPSGGSGRSPAMEGSSGPFSHVPKAKPFDVPIPTRPHAIAPPAASKPLSDPVARPRATAAVGNAPLPDVAAKEAATPVLPTLERRLDRRADEKAAAAPSATGAVEAPSLPLASWESEEEPDREVAELDLPGEFDEVDPEELDAEEDLLEDPPELVRVPEALDIDDEEEELEPLAVADDMDESRDGELEERSLDVEEENDEPAAIAEALDRIEVGDNDLEETLEDAAEPVAVLPTPEDETPGETRGGSACWEQVGLFDEEAAVEHEPPLPAETAPADQETAEPAAPAPVALREDPEPAYVITPAAERRAEPRKVRAQAAAPELDTLTYEAGRLVLEENRVAVSMLQKRFKLDFDQACQVLDRLQGAGLIGPYVGGRSREILLSPEEWESVAHA
jgi:hypothetical protein